MYQKKRLLTASILLLSVLFTACEDPSNVGIGLIGDQGGEPRVDTIATSFFENEQAKDVTGGADRILAGTVADPMLGTITAYGHFDLLPLETISEAFRNNPVTSAELSLFNEYQYGDTTATITLRLREIAADWDDVGAGADTSLQIGELVTEFSFPATDSVIVVPLPESWIALRDTTLRSTTFSTQFHGFTIEPASESAVIGFRADDTELQVIAGQDTVSFGASETLSTLERSGNVTLPPDRLLFQDGIGSTVAFGFDFAAENITNNAINRIEFRIAADTTFPAEYTPTGFHRPLLRNLELFGITGDGESLSFGEVFTLDDDGYYSLASGTLTSIVQQVLLGSTILDHFALRVPRNPNSINAIMLMDVSDVQFAPHAILTITPISD